MGDDMRTIAILVSISILFGCSNLSTRQVAAEGIEGTQEVIGEISDMSVGDIKACWDPHSKEFIIVGGQDLFGKDINGDPDQVHTRFVYTTDGEELETIEYIDDPDCRDYQRYVDVAVDPVNDLALISGMKGGLWKLEGGGMSEIGTDIDRTFSITFHPGGGYALLGNQEQLFRYEDGVMTEIETNGHGCWGYCSWAPGGEYVLLADGGLDEIGRYDGREFEVLDLPASDELPFVVHTVSFSPIEEFALIGTQSYMIDGPYQNLYGYDGKGFELIEGALNSFPETPYWTPDGTCAYIMGERLMIYNIEDGDLKEEKVMNEDGRILGVQPDGEYLLIMKYNHDDMDFNTNVELWRWDLKASEPEDESSSTPFVPLSMLLLAAIMLVFTWWDRKRI